jgi:hypothetical protein
MTARTCYHIWNCAQLFITSKHLTARGKVFLGWSISIPPQGGEAATVTCRLIRNDICRSEVKPINGIVKEISNSTYFISKAILNLNTLFSPVPFMGPWMVVPFVEPPCPWMGRFREWDRTGLQIALDHILSPARTSRNAYLLDYPFNGKLFLITIFDATGYCGVL